MSYGISCWPYGDRQACDRMIEDRPLEGHETFMSRAGREGWVIGHYDGQAYYCCPEHRDCVWDPNRLEGCATRRPFSFRVALLRATRKAVSKRKSGFRRYQHTSLRGFRFLNCRFGMSWAERRDAARAEARA